MLTKHYKAHDGQIFGIDEGHPIPPGLVELTAEELAALFAPPPAQVPQVVSIRQAHRALRARGLLTTVLAGIQAAIDEMPSPQREDAQIDYDKATEWRRDDPLLQQLSPTLGLTPEDLDALFTAGAAL